MSPIFKRCPTCGGGRIRLVEGEYREKVGRKQVVVKNLRRRECPDCGEVLLDYEAVKKLEEASSSKRVRKSA